MHHRKIIERSQSLDVHVSAIIPTDPLISKRSTRKHDTFKLCCAYRRSRFSTHRAISAAQCKGGLRVASSTNTSISKPSLSHLLTHAQILGTVSTLAPRVVMMILMQGKFKRQSPTSHRLLQIFSARPINTTTITGLSCMHSLEATARLRT
jgi:hypothetical protein